MKLLLVIVGLLVVQCSRASDIKNNFEKDQFNSLDPHKAALQYVRMLRNQGYLPLPTSPENTQELPQLKPKEIEDFFKKYCSPKNSN